MSAVAMVRRLGRSVARLARTRYPRFVFGLDAAPDAVTAFFLHDVTVDGFAADLRYLRQNGYRCVTTSEFVRTRGRTQNGRELLLTFDDARASFWTVVFPLLQEFQVPATLFVPSYWPGTDGFMTWEQIRTCARSGLVDVQSHAHRHALVSVSRRLVGFASPAMRHHVFDWPMRHEHGADVLGAAPAGTPIYESRPLLSATHRVLDSDEAITACRTHVAREGPEFFGHPGWSRVLHRLHQRASRAGWRVLSGDAWWAVIAEELLRSRETLRREVGIEPRYLAYPWELGSRQSVTVAGEIGFDALFGVGMDAGRTARWSVAPPAFARFRGDWLRFLPGTGRAHLHRVLPGKVRDLVRSAPLAQ